MRKVIMGLLFIAILVMSVSVVMAIPTTKNPHVDTYGGGAATVVATGNDLDTPSHLQDWYGGDHWNCFEVTNRIGSKYVQNKLAHGWILWTWNYPSGGDTGNVKIVGTYLCRREVMDE